ncbi:MAG: hypothetical protein ACTHMY_05035 [Solirubrobacteraceae bacterium]
MASNDETARYREAAHRALEQLDWCIEYLRTIRKTQISKRLAKNRAAIARTLAQHEDDRHART